MESIKKSYDFKRVYNHKDSTADKLLVLYVLKNGLSNSRVGISVSKKVGKSHTRNKIKRRIKEILRLNDALIKDGYDLVVVVRVRCNDASFEDIKNSLMKLLEEKGILK